MISMTCVLLTVLLNRYWPRCQDISDKFWKCRYYEKYDFSKEHYNPFFKALVFTVWKCEKNVNNNYDWESMIYKQLHVTI